MSFSNQHALTLWLFLSLTNSLTIYTIRTQCDQLVRLFFNIGQFITKDIHPKHEILPKTNLSFYKLPKDLQNWRYIAKSGTLHTLSLLHRLSLCMSLILYRSISLTQNMFLILYVSFSHSQVHTPSLSHSQALYAYITQPYTHCAPFYHILWHQIGLF